MSQYVSKFSGVEIDRAVAYYNDMQRIGRTILQVPIKTTDWLDSSGDDTSIANYCVDIASDGVNAISISSSALAFPPQVYFLDGTGLRWETEYRFTVGANNKNRIRCFSNAQMAGTIVIVSVLSNGILGGDSSFDDLTVGNLNVTGVIRQSIT